MRRLLVFLAGFALSVSAYAVDTKVSAMTNLGTLATGDEFFCVDDPGGSPLDRACTIDVVQTYVLQGEAATCTAFAADPLDCGVNAFANAIAASGNLTCAQPNFTDLAGAATDAQVPDAHSHAADAIDLISEIATALKSGLDVTLITGTAGSANQGVVWNADGDAVGASATMTVGNPTDPAENAVGLGGDNGTLFLCQESSPASTSEPCMGFDANEILQFTNATFDLADGSGTVPVAAVGAAHIDLITEIAAALKAGADGQLLTGTPGLTDECAKWNVDGDLVTTGAGCGGAPATADITDVAVTQTELAELETIGTTVIEAADWTAVAALVGVNTGDQNLADTVAEITDLDNDAATLSLPASTTISAFGATVVDDADAAAARTTLGAAGTAGSTLTGVHDAGGATSFEIPNGANPTVNAAGEIAEDTTDTQLVLGANGRVVAQDPKSACIVVENLAAADDDFPMPISAGQTIELISAFGHCQGTCTLEADISFEYVEVGTATPTVTAVTGSVTTEDYITGDSATTLSGSTTVTALDVLRFDVDNAVSPETDTYTICVNYRLART